MKFIINLSDLLPRLAPSDYFEMARGNTVATYKIMLLCVADENGKLLSGPDARNAIDEMCERSMSKFSAIQAQFIKAFTDALVPPANGNG